MGDDENDHDATIIMDFVDDAVIADADTPEELVAGEFGAAVRSGIMGKGVDALLKLPLSRLGNPR